LAIVAAGYKIAAMQFRLRTLLIVLAAAPLWVYVTTIISTANRLQRLDRTGLVMVPILLAGIAAALYWLIRQLPDGLAIAVLLSPIIVLGVLAISAIS
jgi:hypothetical protein